MFILKSVDLGRFEFDFEILSVDPNREEEDEPFDVKNFEKNILKKNYCAAALLSTTAPEEIRPLNLLLL